MDHFLLSSTLFDVTVVVTWVWHDSGNLSDHDPVFLKLNLNSQFVSLADHVYSARPAWYKAGRNELEHYQTALAKYLAQIVVPVDAIVCHNVFCNDTSHGADSIQFSSQIFKVHAWPE